ncbi:MAG TPA: hypothetical protein VEC36_01730 [Patescibacteria group bacterium]|nr:hypothetical protein [Patescibacteria group bacterium]
MSKIIYESERYFQLHDYVNSHGQLLLRSNKNDALKTNIDIIFFDTNFIQIAADLEKISISKV